MTKSTKQFNEMEARIKANHLTFDTDKALKHAEYKLDEIEAYYLRKHKRKLADANIRNLGEAGTRELLAKLGMWLKDNPKAVK